MLLFKITLMIWVFGIISFFVAVISCIVLRKDPPPDNHPVYKVFAAIVVLMLLSFICSSIYGTYLILASLYRFVGA